MPSLLIARAPLASGFVETWTLNDPASRNALTDPMVDALLDACTRARDDGALRGVVLRGAGGTSAQAAAWGALPKPLVNRWTPVCQTRWCR